MLFLNKELKLMLLIFLKINSKEMTSKSKFCLFLVIMMHYTIDIKIILIRHNFHKINPNFYYYIFI